MRPRGWGEKVRRDSAKVGDPARPDTPKEAVRVSPETWLRLAALRKPLRDWEGRVVALESFDLTLRRLLDERGTVGPTNEGQMGVKP